MATQIQSMHVSVADSLLQVQERREAAVADWFNRLYAVDEAVRLLELAQGGLSRPELAVRLGGQARVELGAREILRSLVELANGGEFGPTRGTRDSDTPGRAPRVRGPRDSRTAALRR